MANVIRVDDEVMDELKRKAVEFKKPLNKLCVVDILSCFSR